MSREFAAVNVTIWGDPDFRALPPAAQHLYLLLWTAPALSYCGVHDWRPGRLSVLSQGYVAEHVQTVADCLIARHFIVVDKQSEEVLVRSWARFDGLLKQPRMAVSYASSYAAVASPTLRQVLAYETQKMAETQPELICWRDHRLTNILGHPSISAKDLPTPRDPFGPGSDPRLALACPQFGPNATSVCPPAQTPPTPAPAPTPTNNKRESAKRAASIVIPDTWQPTETHRDYASTNGIDLSAEVFKFRNHAIANDRRQVRWDATFSTWLAKTKDYAPKQSPRALRDDIPESCR